MFVCGKVWQKGLCNSMGTGAQPYPARPFNTVQCSYQHSLLASVCALSKILTIQQDESCGGHTELQC